MTRYISAYLKRNIEIWTLMDEMEAKHHNEFWKMHHLETMKRAKEIDIDIRPTTIQILKQSGVIKRKNYTKEEIAAGKMRSLKTISREYQLTERCIRFLVDNRASRKEEMARLSQQTRPTA